MKKIRNMLAIILLLLCGSIHAQKFVAKQVKSEFAKYSQIAVVEDLITADTGFRNSNVQKVVEKADFYKFNTEKAAELLKRQQPILSLGFYVDGKYIIVDLVSNSDIFNNAIIREAGGKEIDMGADMPVFYKGVVRGEEENSIVALTITKEEISGFISIPEGNLILGKLTDSSEHILYNSHYLLDKPELICGTKGIGDIEATRQTLQKDISFVDRCVRMSYHIESDFYTYFGNFTAEGNHIMAFHNQVATLYFNDGIRAPLGGVIMYGAVDPYTAGNVYDLLTQFQANILSVGGGGESTSLDGDVGILITSRGTNTTQTGLAAVVGGLCNSNVDLKLAVAFIKIAYSNVPTFNLPVEIVTHEFGHLLGSPHTHACAWNGNNTAIDSCAGGVEGSCPVPSPTPAGGGTIMSYCTDSMVFYNGFGLQPGNKIRSYVSAATCLDNCCVEELNVTGLVPVSQEFKVQNVLTASCTIQDNIQVDFRGEAVLLESGFYVRGQSSGKFWANTDACVPLSGFAGSSVVSESENSEYTVKANDGISLKLLPNPASEKVTVISDTPIINVTVIALDGAAIFNSVADGKTKTFDIDVRSYYKGFYIVNVTTADGRTEARKLIKN